MCGGLTNSNKLLMVINTQVYRNNIKYNTKWICFQLKDASKQFKWERHIWLMFSPYYDVIRLIIHVYGVQGST